jgi:hypothetical protein
MPRRDDEGILGDAILIRAIRPEWLIPDGNGVRLCTGTFVDGQLEASCFLAEEMGGIERFLRDTLPKLSEELEVVLRAATISASLVRARGLWIFRRPEEYYNNPAHVVICAPDGISKSRYRKDAAKLADDATLL